MTKVLCRVYIMPRYRIDDRNLMLVRRISKYYNVHYVNLADNVSPSERSEDEALLK